jgi:hypothetical protein
MASWWNRFGQKWASGGAVNDPTDAQANAGWAFIGQAPPTVEQFNSLQQWDDSKDNWLYGQIGNVVIDAGLTNVETDLMLLLKALNKRQKAKLTSDLTLFVNVLAGSDITGDGSNAKPFRTVQVAINYCYNSIDAAGNSVIIQLQVAATYDPFLTNRNFGGNIFVQGDILNPRNYIVKNTNGPAVAATGASVLFLRGLSIEAAGSNTPYSPSGVGVVVQAGAVVLYENIAFGVCSSMHIWTVLGGQFYPYMRTGPTQIPAYSIYGASPAHFYSSNGGSITVVNAAITLTSTFAFSNAFAVAESTGFIQAWGSTTITGTATGTRYIVASNGVINATAKGITLFPGSIAGATSTGGQYIP